MWADPDRLLRDLDCPGDCKRRTDGDLCPGCEADLDDALWGHVPLRDELVESMP